MCWSCVVIFNSSSAYSTSKTVLRDCQVLIKFEDKQKVITLRDSLLIESRWRYVNYLTPCLLSNFRLLIVFFFQNHLFRKNLSGIPSECQTVWIQIRPDILSGLIRVQSVWKGYQHTRLHVVCKVLNQPWAYNIKKPDCFQRMDRHTMYRHDHN